MQTFICITDLKIRISVKTDCKHERGVIKSISSMETGEGRKDKHLPEDEREGITMTKKLFFQAIGKMTAGFVVMALCLFVPAGSVHYFNAWLLLFLLFVPMFAAGFFLMLYDPARLQKRLSAKETEREQKWVIAASGSMFLAAFVTAGLNDRFGWFALPPWVVWAASGVFLAAYLMYAEVLRENAYLSRTVEIQAGQKVISSGLYGVVRHPMYAATVLLFLSMGLILNSPISFAILLFYIPIIGIRIQNEEKVLSDGLDGYKEYQKKVKYRLIPFVW